MLTTGIAFFAECNTRQTFYRQRVLCWVLFSDTRKRKPLDKLRIEKIQKNSKTFFKIIGTTLQPLSITIPIALLFFTIILNQIYKFCEWWDSNSQPLSRAYRPIPLQYYINYVYITFSILMYYNKPRVIWLFKALNEFIWKCVQL
jgi:hypothetical protein